MKIRITPGALLLCIVLALGKSAFFPATLLAAAVHECGHLLAARALSIRLRLLELDLMGAQIYPAGPIPSYRSEAVLAGAGPLFSVLLALALRPFSGEFAALVTSSTLSFALFNLLPIEGFDGGRVLSALLHAHLMPRTAGRLLCVTSYLSMLLLFSLSACLLLRFGETMTLAVLCASLFARLFLSLDGQK